MSLRHYIELFAALCHARLRVVTVSCVILAASGVAFGLIYLRLDSVVGERVDEALLSVPVSPPAAVALVERLTNDVHKLVMGQLWVLSVIGLSFGAVLFLGSEIPLLLTSLVVEAVLLPSDEWAREYRRNRDAYERNLGVGGTLRVHRSDCNC